ncbi:methyl-accepting chemotaxis protein [Caldimonas brevitalea]|uniref:Chemotaxis protein n=1 Tax=Caldimonas brevitalea TaxID=413882 RepID=A0A0G3BL33_9BURK|nr:methyl-accepting chemotaxis protein [Caldimonas brevitalea]AKJ28693.1 chemotaxis protein [Caldimonas brevitalea]
MLIKNLSIRARLIFVLCFLAVQLAVGAFIGIYSLRDANQSMATMYDDRLVALGQLDRVIRLLNVNQTLLAQALVLPADKVAAHLRTVEANAATIDQVWKQYLATYLTPAEKALAGEFDQARGQMLQGGVKPTVAALRAGDVAKATELLIGPVTTLYLPTREAGDKLIELQLSESATLRQEAQAHYELVRNVCSLAVFFGLLVACGFGVWLVRSIVGPLSMAVRITDRVAQGDLTQRIETNATDETGQLLNALQRMNQGLVGIVARVRNGSDCIATGSTQIASGNQDLSQRTEEQASNLQQTAASMEQLTATVKQNADTAREATRLAQGASAAATEGGRVVGQVVATMDDITRASNKIADIIGVIDGIAFQTNILALNAAVEAARAGEQGRGFAVVAGEVRGLAQRSAQAAKEIKVLIGDSVTKVESGSALVNEAGASINNIVQQVSRVRDLIEEISSATAQQSSGIEQVGDAVQQLDQVTQQNAALVEESAAAAESLKHQADELARVVSVFRVA